MKADEDVKMISAEAPVLFAKACEMFIIELTHRSYYHTIENKRKTLQRSDIAQTIASTDIYDFLQDIIPKEELREAQASNAKAQEELNLKNSQAGVAPGAAIDQRDIMAGGLSLENTPQVKPGSAGYLKAPHTGDDDDDDINNDGAEGGLGGNPSQSLRLFTETDPSNLNQHEVKPKKSSK